MKILTVTLFLAVISGCAEQPYSIEVENVGDEDLTGVGVWYGKKMASFGVMPPGKRAVRGGISTPPPEEVVVKWIDSSGRTVSVTVEISGLVPGQYKDGELRFRIGPGNTVSASFEKAYSIF